MIIPVGWMAALVFGAVLLCLACPIYLAVALIRDWRKGELW